MPDNFEQQTKDIVKTVLQQEIDFSVYPPGGPTADDVAGKIASALWSASIVQSTDIGSRAEYEKSAE